MANPLFLPIGSIRALLTLGLLASILVAGFFELNEVIPVLRDAFLVIVGFYFGSRLCKEQKD